MLLEDAAVAVAAAAVLALLAVVLLAVRRRSLTRHCGSFDCSVRGVGGQRWTLGVARVVDQRVEWWKVLSLSPRPRTCWARRDLVVLERRWPRGDDAAGVLPRAVLVTCRHGQDDLDLAMSEDAYTGFASWLEAAPPGPQSSVT